jgi:hypothetical protein
MVIIPCRAPHGSDRPSPWAGSGSLFTERIPPSLFFGNWASRLGHRPYQNQGPTMVCLISISRTVAPGFLRDSPFLRQTIVSFCFGENLVSDVISVGNPIALTSTVTFQANGKFANLRFVQGTNRTEMLPGFTGGIGSMQ